jgi:hypothetical protein
MRVTEILQRLLCRSEGDYSNRNMSAFQMAQHYWKTEFPLLEYRIEKLLENCVTSTSQTILVDITYLAYKYCFDTFILMVLH